LPQPPSHSRLQQRKEARARRPASPNQGLDGTCRFEKQIAYQVSYPNQVAQTSVVKQFLSRFRAVVFERLKLQTIKRRATRRDVSNSESG
jgi:hypothetical protein